MHKYIFLALLATASLFGQCQAQDLTAAGCGPSKTNFSVKTNKKHSAVAQQPDAGHALVYVIEQQQNAPGSLDIVHLTTRVGLDGNWMGANHGDSYMSFSVEPGSHRLCSDVRSVLAAPYHLEGAADLTAEAGQTYYYEVGIWTGDHDRSSHLWIKEADEAEGALLIARNALSTSKTKN